MQAYQGIDAEKDGFDPLRALFAFFPTYRNSPLPSSWDRVLHCGDSLHHDVAGANAAGIHSLFVAGGIHADELPPEGQLSSEALSRLFDEEGIAPTLSVEKFVW